MYQSNLLYVFIGLTVCVPLQSVAKALDTHSTFYLTFYKSQNTPRASYRGEDCPVFLIWQE